ncbi:gltA, partial [Symbiodinium necroappetens]
MKGLFWQKKAVTVIQSAVFMACFFGGSPTASGDDAPEAVLKLPNGKEHRIKVLKPTLGEELFLDIRDLHRSTGYFVYDPGFTCTGSCMSAITFIDGPKGVCLYRGFPVPDLVDSAQALEVAYLLLVGEKPDPEQYLQFQKEIKQHMLVHEKVKAMFTNFTINAHPMAIMVAVIGALSSVFSELDPSNEIHRWLACTRLIAKVPVLACMAYKTSIGQPFMYPRADLSFAENFLYMMFATPMEEYSVNPVSAKAINAFMILHMDHEQNASTSTVRIAGSSQANPYACIAAGVASLWGPAHGGANEAVINMLEQIGSKDKVAQFVADVKAKKEGVRLMGFGHRVYKNYDPRARVMKTLVAEVLKELGVEDPLLGIAQELEKVALSDSYFIDRKLYPNVDYYSGIMLRAIGIPTSMFTVMFAMSRTVGWVSQWNEMVSEKQMRIGRPRQLYVGPGERKEPWKAAQDLDSSTAKEVVIDNSSQGPIRFKPR